MWSLEMILQRKSRVNEDAIASSTQLGVQSFVSCQLLAFSCQAPFDVRQRAARPA